MNFQYPIHYGAFTPCQQAGGRGGRGAFGPGAAAQGGAGQEAAAAVPAPPPVDPACPTAFERDFEVVWPAPGIGDMQGGMGRTRMPAQNLNHFTATTGPSIVRGDRVPEDLKGDLLFTEPVGRLIRRAKIVKTEVCAPETPIRFGIRDGTDQLFRPVNIQTGPDGTTAIADMYHGIIQNFNGPGPAVPARQDQQSARRVAVCANGFDTTAAPPSRRPRPIPARPRSRDCARSVATEAARRRRS
jgi:hypothetical protein